MFLIVTLASVLFYQLLTQEYAAQQRLQAQTVVGNVEAFGTWVAKQGRVWNFAADSSSYLSERILVDPKDTSATPLHAFSKNPALAQREFSEVVMESSTPAKFRMTSHNVMNPINAPDAFETRAINAMKSLSVKEYSEEIGDRYRYAQAVYHKAACISCHGNPKDAPADVIARYGDKNGFGFKEGDVAGVISVSIPRASFWQSVGRLLGPMEAALLVLMVILLAWVCKIALNRPPHEK